MKLSTSTENPQKQSRARDAADFVIKKMRLAYGKQFNDKWAGVDPEEMAESLAASFAGYTPSEIKTGIDKIEKTQYPPNWPEFILMCRPAMPPEAIYSACHRAVMARGRGEYGEWPSKAAYHAYIRFGHHDFVNSNWGAAKNTFTDLLQKAQAQEVQGLLSDIPPPLVLLPEPVTPRPDAQKKIREILKTLYKKIEE